MNPNTNLILDPEKVSALIAEALSEVFADMVFLDAVRDDAVRDDAVRDDAARDESTECIALDVLKPVSLRIELRFSPRLKALVNENLSLGDGSSEGEDSLLEILNVTVGNFLIKYYGPDIEPKLELPEYLYFSDENGGDLVAKVRMAVEGEKVEASVRSVRYHY